MKTQPKDSADFKADPIAADPSDKLAIGDLVSVQNPTSPAHEGLWRIWYRKFPDASGEVLVRLAPSNESGGGRDGRITDIPLLQLILVKPSFELKSPKDSYEGEKESDAKQHSNVQEQPQAPQEAPQADSSRPALGVQRKSAAPRKAV